MKAKNKSQAECETLSKEIENLEATLKLSGADKDSKGDNITNLQDELARQVFPIKEIRLDKILLLYLYLNPWGGIPFR